MFYICSGVAGDENADNLRERIRQAPEKFSNAGSRGAYRYHTLSAHQSITDVKLTKEILKKRGYEQLPCDLSFKRYAENFRKNNYAE